MLSLVPVVAVASTLPVAEAEEVILTVGVAVAADGISGSTVGTYLSPFHFSYECYLLSEHLLHQFQLMNMNVFMYSTLICPNIVVFEIH